MTFKVMARETIVLMCEQKPYLVWFPCPLSGASDIRCPLSVPAIRYSDSLLGIVGCAYKNYDRGGFIESRVTPGNDNALYFTESLVKAYSSFVSCNYVVFLPL